MGKFRTSLLMLFITISTAFGQMNTDRVLTIGRNALYFEDYVLSIQYFNQVINTKPYLFEPYFFRGYSKFSLGDYEGAIYDCSNALKINPFYIDAYLIRGISKQAISDYEGANNDFNQGLEYDINNTGLMINRGVGKLEMKDFEGAIQDFSNAIKEKSGFMLAYLNRGRAYLELNDTVDAINDFDKAVELNPFHIGALSMRGALLAEMKEYEKALLDYDVAIRMEPKESGLYINRGLIRYFTHDLMGAIADYDKALEVNPNSLITYYNRGLLRAQIGDVNRAVDDFNNVLKMDPGNHTALLNRALMQIEIGEYLLAIDDLDQIIQRHPDFPVAYYARSQAKQALNDTEGARRDYNTGYALEFNNNKNNKNTAKDLALGPGKDDPKESTKENNKDVRNYKKILVVNEDVEDASTGFRNAIRGRVQYRNIAIDLEHDFSISFYADKRMLDKSPYYSKDLEQFNARITQLTLYLTKNIHALSQTEINTHFSRIERLSQALESNKNNREALFERALHYTLIKDFNSALSDLNRVLDLEPNFMLGYFARGVVRFKMVEFIRSVEDVSETEISLNMGVGLKSPSTDKAKKQERFLDYDLIIRDYNRVEQLTPNFAYMYFNRGNLRATLKDFKAAIADYTKAIEKEPEMAEAYFNRGLTYIFLGESSKGNRDLSKAGELGLYKAYNVLKRYGTTQE